MRLRFASPYSAEEELRRAKTPRRPRVSAGLGMRSDPTAVRHDRTEQAMNPANTTEPDVVGTDLPPVAIGRCFDANEAFAAGRGWSGDGVNAATAVAAEIPRVRAAAIN